MTDTVLDSFLRTTAEFPGRAAFIHGERQLTFAQLSQLSSQVAAGLAGTGVAPGMMVGVLVREALNFPVACLALWRLGAVVVPFDPDAPAEDRAARESIADLPFILADADMSPTRQSSRVLRMSDFGNSPAHSAPPPPPGDDCLVIFTSGTTGQPKALVHTHASLAMCARGVISIGNVIRDDVVLATIPLQLAVGMGALLLAPLIAGATVVLAQPFSPRLALAAALKWKVTSIPTVPAVARLLAALPESLGRPRLRRFNTGAAKPDKETFDRIQARYGIRLDRGYGMSELGAISSTAGRDRSEYRPIAGWPCVELRLLDDDGREVPQGEAGEVAVRSAALCRPYYLTEGGGREPLPMRDGFFLTGDIGRLEPDGALMLVGRKKEFILGPRLRVNPHEVEAVILQVPGVRDTAVVPAPGRHGYEAIHAFVVADAGVDEAAIANFCALHLPAGKRPQIIDFIDAIPRNTAGKVARWRLPPPK